MVMPKKSKVAENILMNVTIRKGTSDDLAGCTDVRADWLGRFQIFHAEGECTCPAGLPVPWIETIDQLRSHLATADRGHALIAGAPGKQIAAYLLYQINEDRGEVVIRGHQPKWRDGAFAAAGAVLDHLLDHLGQLPARRVSVALHGFAWETGMLRMLYGARGFHGNLRFEMLSRSFNLDAGRPKVSVRMLEVSDPEAFYDAEVTVGRFGSAEESRDDCEMSRKMWLVAPARDWVIACVHGQVVGTVRVAVTRNQIGVLDGLHVREDSRGKGIGRALLCKALHTLKDRTNVIWLDVDDDNEPAISLYRAAGFRIQHYSSTMQFTSA